ncbi:MAG: hypothetical protein J5849_03855 [Clostridia bacterium]|nr:hypothetical protein [Clostridia bacterium]
MDSLVCVRCGAPLDRDDMGATKKLINRGATSFLCVKCLALHFSVEEKLIREKIEAFKKDGCTLFV